MKSTKLLIVLLFSLFVFQLNAQTYFGLIPYKSGELWGYVNNKNVLKIPCKYESANFFKYDIANVTVKKQNLALGVDNKSVNAKGEVVFSKYGFLSNFRNGIAIFGIQEIKKSFDGMPLFSVGAIDSTGKEIIPQKYRSLDFLLNKNYLSGEDATGNYYIFNKKGEIVIETGKNKPYVFNGKYIIVTSENSENSLLYSVIDTKGNVIIPATKNRLNNIIGNFILFTDLSKPDEEKGGLMDIGGKVIIDPWVYDIYFNDKVNEGVCLVQKHLSDDLSLYGFVDTTGKEVIPLIYEEVSAFKNGTAFAKLKGKFGLIDKQNNVIAAFKYDDILQFSEGKAVFRINEKMGYITDKGTEIIAPIYNDAQAFDENMAIVSLNNKFGFIDANGKVVVDIKYQEVQPFKNRVSVVKQNNKYGIIDRSGKETIPCKFDQIGNYSNDLTDTTTFKKTDIFLDDFNEEGFAIIENLQKIDDAYYYNILGYIDIYGNEYFDDGNVLKAKQIKSYPTICDAILAKDIDAIKEFVSDGIDLNKTYQYKNIYGTITTGYPIDVLIWNQNQEFISLFKLFMEHGNNPNIRASGYPLIISAIYHVKSKDDVLTIMQLLLDKQANINDLDDNNRNVINALCQYQSIYQRIGCSDTYDIAEFLLKHGADPNIKDNEGKSAIKNAKPAKCDQLNELFKSYKK